MTDISKIEKYGAGSFIKARAERPRVRKLRTLGHLAFKIISRRPDRPRYIVRLAIERGRAFAECVDARTGEPCQGFSRWHHCYHLGRALIHVGALNVRN